MPAESRDSSAASSPAATGVRASDTQTSVPASAAASSNLAKRCWQ